SLISREELPTLQRCGGTGFDCQALTCGQKYLQRGHRQLQRHLLRIHPVQDASGKSLYALRGGLSSPGA
ncbi:MAG: hypothetical protein IPG64_20125, partial [Haliea sp.]|nr:hypothetical protein [Haliea sp.]